MGLNDTKRKRLVTALAKLSKEGAFVPAVEIAVESGLTSREVGLILRVVQVEKIGAKPFLYRMPQVLGQ
jgi:hypothetical protein